MLTADELRRVRFTHHALTVMKRRDISPEEVANALADPQIVEPHQGKRRFVRDGLAVVVAPDLAIVTILLRSSVQWTDADARARRR